MHLLSVKFIGPALETRSVPISDLGKTLVAFQQIIYKCYLYKEERLRPGAQLTHAEKNNLALQIDEYSKWPMERRLHNRNRLRQGSGDPATGWSVLSSQRVWDQPVTDW